MAIVVLASCGIEVIFGGGLEGFGGVLGNERGEWGRERRSGWGEVVVVVVVVVVIRGLWDSEGRKGMVTKAIMMDSGGLVGGEVVRVCF